MDPVQSQLPAILCLHGGGTSAEIFEIQTRRIQNALRGKFQFVFINGPFVAPPGPGVLPFFEGFGPYYSWRKEGQNSARSHELLRRVMEEQARKPSGPFCGVMGFSQGAGMAAGLILSQQEEVDEEADDEAAEDDGDDGFASPRIDLRLRFGVFFNGVAAPILAQPATPGLAHQKIRLPTVHVHGNLDPWRESGEILLAENFEEATARVMESQVGHQLPVLKEETLRVADMILHAYSEGGGQGQVLHGKETAVI